MHAEVPSEGALRANWAEVAAVVATALLHLLVSNLLDLNAVFIAIALTGWIAYAVWRRRRDPRALVRWGFGRAGLRPTFVATSVFAALAIVVMAWIGAEREFLRLDVSLLLLLLLYPAWGLIQQLLVQALVAGNLRRTTGWTRSAWFVVPFCAILFGLVHVPDPWLMGATFLLGLLFTPVYLRWGNLWPLGLYHGWLGALFYVWVLGRNPWGELFG